MRDEVMAKHVRPILCMVLTVFQLTGCSYAEYLKDVESISLTYDEHASGDCKYLGKAYSRKTVIGSMDKYTNNRRANDEADKDVKRQAYSNGGNLIVLEERYRNVALYEGQQGIEGIAVRRGDIYKCN